MSESKNTSANETPAAQNKLLTEQTLAAFSEQLSAKVSVPDAGCAASAVTAAMESAWLNVLVNTRSLPEDAEAKRYEAEAWEMCEDGLPRAAAIYQRVHGILLGQVQ